MTLQTNVKSMKKTLVLIAAAAGLAFAAQPAAAAGSPHELRKGGFSFEGPFGTFDQGQLQRGYKVYREVCASCHGMDLMYFRTLAEPGGPFYDSHQINPAENRFVKALAAEAQVPDIDSETGEAIMRDAVSSRIQRKSSAATKWSVPRIGQDRTMVRSARARSTSIWVAAPDRSPTAHSAPR